MSRAENNISGQPLKELLTYGAQQIEQAGIENPARESRMLMAYALGESSDHIFLKRNSMEIVPATTFLACVARRVAHEPMAYITGAQGFWTLDLAVSPATLIPRPDSEAVISSLSGALADKKGAYSFLDLGTGTGCLLLAALDEYPYAWGLGIDINPDAALLAARNARSCDLSHRASFFAGSWDHALKGDVRFDVVISNPPYIPTADLQTLMPDVRLYEPVAALDGGADGMDAYRFLCSRLPFLLSPQGVAIFEIGIHQRPDLQAVAENAGLEVVQVCADLAGIERAVTLKVRT